MVFAPIFFIFKQRLKRTEVTPRLSIKYPLVLELLYLETCDFISDIWCHEREQTYSRVGMSLLTSAQMLTP